MEVDALADVIEPVYERSICIAEEFLDADDTDRIYHMPGGESPDVNLRELLDCELDVAEAIRDSLSRRNFRAIKDGGIDLFEASEMNYRLEAPVSSEFSDNWFDFSMSVKHRARFSATSRKIS